MPWSSHSLQQSFQGLINQLVDFHDQCGKAKNSEQFRNIRSACEAAITFLYANEMPSGADTIVSSLSGGIFATLGAIGAKKEGSDSNYDFIRRLMSATQAIVLFRNVCENEIRKHEIKKKPSKIHVTSDGVETQISMNQAMTHLMSQEELLEKIESLSETPVQSYSCFAFFKRTAMYYPKITAASGIIGSTGLGYSILSTLSHFVGPSLDTLIHADQTGITHQVIFAGTLLLTSASLLSAAAIGTCVNSTDNEVDEGPSLLRRI